MTLVKYTIPLLALVLLIPPGITNTIAQGTIGEVEPYTREEIMHSFHIMEEYVMYGEYKHITFDLDRASQNPHVSQLDIEIALNYAVYSNELIDILLGETGEVGQVNELETNDEIRRLLQEFEEGQFRALFEKESHIGTVSETTLSTNPYLSKTASDTFEDVEISGVTHIWYDPLICGGGFTHPHMEPKPMNSIRTFQSKDSAKQYLVHNGFYEVIEWHATTVWGDDYAKIVDAYDCTYGSFRYQSTIKESDSGYYYLRNQFAPGEPNPELDGYDWPHFTWPVYTGWWHVIYTGF
jgi:hypothetical protein